MANERYGDRRVWHTGHGPNGRRVCRWCGTETAPPRRTWCSQSCVDEWMVRSSSARMRQAIFRRDQGVCAVCGCDTELLRRVLWHVWRSREGADWFDSLLGEIGLSGNVLSRTLWEADHIVPVVRGGGGCGPENIRTLCVPCHRAETARLAADRARERRDAKRGLLTEAS